MISLERRSLEILVKYSTGLDKKNQPDLFHPITVERSITERGYQYKLTDLTILRCTALLHDIVEDGYLTLDELREELEKDRQFFILEQFHEIDKIIEYVDILTHRKGERYTDYIERVCQNPKTAWIKRMDIWHNMSDERSYGLDQPTIDRLYLKYINALDIIDERIWEYDPNKGEKEL